MPCGCKSKSRFQVKANGKIVFVTSNQTTAEMVARRYPNSEVVELANA